MSISLNDVVDIQHISLVLDSKGRLFLGGNFSNEYLTKREIEILKYILQGYSAKEIGSCLEISYRTVESYFNILKLKLRCSKKSELIALCIKLGIFKLFF